MTPVQRIQAISNLTNMGMDNSNNGVPNRPYVTTAKELADATENFSCVLAEATAALDGKTIRDITRSWED